ncbi:MAG: hypothetical protein HY808_10115, partial [Nitrospirae bacterium]|nr:hypothetical protein [Nitrospirota bacterium]
RILNFKKKITPLCPPLPNYEKHAELSLAISDKAITLVKDTPGLLPVKDVQDVSLIFAGDEDIHKTSPLRNFIPDVSVGAGFKPAGERGLVIVAIFTSVAAWKGSSGIKDEEMQAIRQIMKTAQRSIVISFGSPYVLSHFADAGALIAAYDTTTQAQLSLIKCLKDERDFQGRLPVNLA